MKNQKLDPKLEEQVEKTIDVLIKVADSKGRNGQPIPEVTGHVISIKKAYDIFKGLPENNPLRIKYDFATVSVMYKVLDILEIDVCEDNYLTLAAAFGVDVEHNI